MSIEFFVSITRYDACIIANLYGKEVGKYSFDFEETEGKIEAVSFLESYLPEEGIPRALIKQATETLQQIATRRKKTLVHCVEILLPNPREKLSHIFEEQNYKKYGDAYKRVYIP